MKRAKPSLLRKASVQVLAAWVGLLGFAAPVSAMAYPTQPITLVIPYGPKGDAFMRGQILAKYVQKHFPSFDVQLESRAGDSGAKGASEVSVANGDGYTLLFGRVGSQVIAPAINPKLTYRSSDFTFLGMVEIEPFICAVAADSPYKTHRDLAQAARQTPGSLRYGHVGTATGVNFAAQYWMRLSGLKPTSVPAVEYRDAGELVAALTSRKIDFLCLQSARLLKPIEEGSVRGLFTTAPGRIPQLPLLQNASEAGLRDMTNILGWSALFGPPGMPAPVIARWKTVLKQVSKDPQWVAEIQGSGAVAAIGTSKDNEAYVKTQFEMYRRLVPTLGLRE